jgi:hypothetical protein
MRDETPPIRRSALESASDRGIRAADSDRETVAAQLGEHTAAGRLTLAEFEERVAAVHASRTLADLDELVTDLPRVRPARPPRPRGRMWGPWLRTAGICLAIWAATSIMAGGTLYFWPFWVIVPWGVSLVARSWGRPRRLESRSQVG